MSNNRSSVKHTVSGEGYKYDVIKGELSKGSIISKSIHPVSQVEEYKKKLVERKKLKDMGTHWVLKKNLRTGHLMAINLSEGKLLKESPYKQNVFVSKDEAENLKDNMPIGNIYVNDSKIIMDSIRDTLNFISISLVEVNANIFKNHGADTFGQDEAFVLKFLQERGVVSSSARHGLSNLNEADIVDEVYGEQYEITYEFKTELSKRHMKESFIYSPEILVMQLVESPFIHISKSLRKKLTKEYTNRFSANLVILTIGTTGSTLNMLESMADEFKREEVIKLNYSNIYIISLDFLNENALFVRVSFDGKQLLSDIFPCKNEELGFIKLTPIDFSVINDEEKYLMICNGIFDNKKRMRYDFGKSLKEWVKNVHIWGL